MPAQSAESAGAKLSGSSRRFSSSSVKLPLGIRSTSSANIVNRQRIRKSATGVGLFSRASTRLRSLLGLQHERVALVSVDPSEALRTVGFLLKHPPLKHIIIVGVVGAATLGRIDADQRSEAVDEALRIGQLRAAGWCPFSDKGVNLLGRSGHAIGLVASRALATWPASLLPNCCFASGQRTIVL